MAKETDAPKQEKQKMTRDSLSYWFLISTVMITAAVVTFIILGVLFFAPEVLPVNLPPAPEVAQRVDNLSSEVNTLSNQVKTLEQEKQNAEPDTLQTRLNSLEDRLADISGSTAKMQNVIKGLSDIKKGYDGDDSIIETVTKMSTLVSTLDSRVETIQEENKEIQSNLKDFNSDDIKAANMLLVATQFQGSVDRGMPFASELETIQALFKTDDEANKALTRLQPFANTGIPSNKALMDEFDSLHQDLFKSIVDNDQNAVRSTLKNKLSQYVNIYKESSDLPLGETQAILNRAEDEFVRGDLNGTLLALSQLKGPAAVVAEPFINQVEARLLAERLSKKLSDTAINFIRDAHIGQSSSTAGKKLY